MATTMSGAMQWNVKTTSIAAVAVVVALYVLYSMMQGSSENKIEEKATLKLFDSWKVKDFVQIPNEVKDAMSKVKIDEHHLHLKILDKEYAVYSQSVDPAKKAPSQITVLLLHGAAFTSKNWVETQTLNLLGALGYRAVAIDLPGHGQSKNKQALTSDEKAAFLKEFIEKENLGRPVLVSPSMSGSFSVPFVMGDKPIKCTERVRGYIPLAPTSTDMYTFGQWNKCEAPTMIVYGTKDKSLGLTSLNNLRNLKNKEIFPQEGAGHPSYIEKPEEWRYFLYNFMLQLELFKE